MEISITSLIVLAITLVAAGVLLLLVWPMFTAGKSKNSGPSVTVKGGDSIVTVRSAGGGDVSVFFSTSESSRAEQIVPARSMDDRQAEEEVTILDELRDPDTPAERKAAIEKELLSLGYTIARKPSAPTVTSGKMAGEKTQDKRPEQKPASSKPSEPDDDPDDDSSDKGVDEGLGEQEPQFDGFYAPSE